MWSLALKILATSQLHHGTWDYVPLFHTASDKKLMGPGNKTICSHMTSHDMANGHTRIHTDRTGLKGQTEKWCLRTWWSLSWTYCTSSVVTGNHWVGYDGNVSTKVSPGDRDRPQFKQRELPQSKVAVVHTISQLVGWEKRLYVRKSPTVRNPLSSPP